MPLDSEQKSSLLESAHAWEDLSSDIQEKILLREKSNLLRMIQESDLDNLPPEYFEAASRAWGEAERCLTPWFFIEIFLDEKIDGDETVDQYIDKQVREYCQSAIYINSGKLICGLERI